MGTDPAAFDAFERAAWERTAVAYRDALTGFTGAVVDDLLDAVGVGPRTRLLDAGTGPGLVAARAVARRAEVVGVDASAAMVALAREAVPQATFEQTELASLPFPDASFDAVVGNL